MALPASVRFPVGMDVVFPHGAFAMGVEPETDFERRGRADQQKRDKATGERVWVVRVLDGDPEAVKRGGAEVKVRITSPTAPVLPAPRPGFPFPAVEFDGLTVTPWSDGERCRRSQARNAGQLREIDCSAQVGYSLRAAGVREPGAGRGSGGQAPASKPAA